ncbi:MAG TPA: ABC transporter permease [Hyphomicrobiaceae bacterium]|mgnify:CR=1 FL=1|nr:ABC transporter permease [Hyphomicrobiaceae bacterium]
MSKPFVSLELRREPSQLMLFAAPVIALVLTLVAGLVLFELIGKPPFRAMYLIFVEPLTTYRGLAELLLKSTPLILIGIGLSFGFRAGIWNIGAEGQFIVGALCGGAVALAFHPGGGWWLLPLMMLAGAAGGMAWASIPALLRTRFRTNEILVSLMLVYVADLLLRWAVTGPLKDPQSFNFPESKLFQKAAQMPLLLPQSRAHIGFLVALLVAAVAFVLMSRHMAGYQLRVLGEAPRAARFAGFSEKRIVWLSFLTSGGLAGLAGLFEAAGPVGQLVPALPSGYGFAAIIVAFLGRLRPFGIVLAGLLLGLTAIGGESAQVSLSLPSATTAVFQGMLLFFVLAADVLVNYRVKFARGGPGARSATGS